MYKEDIELFKKMIENSEKTVFFGGAGVSTESGVKDFRSSDGIYATVHEYGISPEEILSHSFFFENPKVYYDFHYKYFLKDEVSPNAAHKALAKLEAENKLSSVITQNIDGLHQAAGSKNVIELHGTTLFNYCTKCNTPFATEKIKELKGDVPYCEKCGGLVRPDIVLYEEALRDDSTENAISEIASADLLIVGGTSLAVYPAASFLQFFKGDNIVLINKSETPYDKKASLIFRDSIGRVLTDAVSE